MNELMKTAAYWLALGVSVIPIRYMDKRPAIEWLQYTELFPTEQEVFRWFSSGQSNIGVIAGWNNLTIIDFDEFDIYEKWGKWCRNVGGKPLRVLKTSRIVCSSRGMHIYLFTKKRTENMKFPGIDIIAQHKYVLAPPSVHPSGIKYIVVRDAVPTHVDTVFDVLPSELINGQINDKVSKNPSTCAIQHSGDNNISDPLEAAENPNPKKTLVFEIKKRFRIEDFFDYKESTDRGAGRWYAARCPFHDDRNPSMAIDTKNQICICMAGCNGGKPMDVINLYAKINNLTNSEALMQMKGML